MMLFGEMFSLNLLIGSFLIAKTFAGLPSYIKPCKVADVACISKITQEIFHNNPNGLKDIGLPTLEPFHLDEVILSDSKQQSPLSLDLKLFNIDVNGLSNVMINRAVGFELNPSTSKFEYYATIPKLDLKGQYTASGRVLILPIQGKGAAFVSLVNCKVSFKFKPSVVEENGKTRLGIKQIKVLLEPENVNIRLENLFNGDKALGENMNLFLNENWKELWSELSPNINGAIKKILQTLISEVFKILYYEDFYQKE